MSRQFRIILGVVAASVVVLTAASCGFVYFSFDYRHGSPPLDGERYRNSAHIVKKGMTEDEVIAALGTPHTREAGRGGTSGESWMYYTDRYYGNYLGIRFSAERRVDHTWIP